MSQSSSSYILVIDDSLLSLKSVSAALQQLNLPDIEIRECQNPLEALNMVRTDEPALILCDLVMPQMPGEEFIKRVRGMGLEVPICAFTANATDVQKRKIEEAGGTDFLVKPVDKEKLRPFLQEHVQVGGSSPLFEDPEQISAWIQEGIGQLNDLYDGLALQPRKSEFAIDIVSVMAGAVIRVEHLGDFVYAGLFSDWQTGEALVRSLFKLRPKAAVTKAQVGDAMGEVLNLSLATMLAKGEASLEGKEGDGENIVINPPKVIFGASCVQVLRSAERKHLSLMKDRQLTLKLAVMGARRRPAEGQKEQ